MLIIGVKLLVDFNVVHFSRFVQSSYPNTLFLNKVVVPFIQFIVVATSQLVLFDVSCIHVSRLVHLSSCNFAPPFLY